MLVYDATDLYWRVISSVYEAKMPRNEQEIG